MSERITGTVNVTVKVEWTDGEHDDLNVDGIRFEGRFSEDPGDNITPPYAEIEGLYLDESEAGLCGGVMAQWADCTSHDNRPLLGPSFYSDVEDAVWDAVSDDVSPYLIDRDTDPT